MKRILIIAETISDSSESPAESIYTLLERDFAVSRRLDFPTQIAWADDETPEAVLMILKGSSLTQGLEFCRKLRRSRLHSHVPVQWLMSQSSSVIERIDAYHGGIDDCLDLPVEPSEFLARLNARLRIKMIREGRERVRICGNLKFDPVAARAWVGEREVALTLKQKEIIAYFMDHPLTVVSRRELLGSVWPHALVSARTIDAHLTLLRRKLWDFDHEIQSVHSVGYRLQPSLANHASEAER